MTAVEWLWRALLDSGFEVVKNVELFKQAKEKEKEQKHELKEKYFIKGYVGAELDNLRYDESTELAAKELFDELIKSE